MLDSTDLPQAAAALEQCIGVLGDAVDPGLRADLEGQARVQNHLTLFQSA